MNPHFIPWRPVIVSGLLVLSGLLLHGCASSRLLKEPVPIKTPDLGRAATVPGQLTLEADQVIVANGGGSWVRDAHWDEYVLTLSNDSQQPVEIEGFDLYSAKLAVPVRSSTSREQLEVQTSRTLQALKDVGIVGGTSVLTAGAAAAAAGSGGGFLVSAATGAAIVAFPIALVGGTSYVISRHIRDKRDKVLIEHNLMDRGFGDGQQISPGMQLKRSAFFPITPAPTRVVVHYMAAAEPRELSLALPALAGLHLKPVSASADSVATKH